MFTVALHVIERLQDGNDDWWKGFENEAAAMLFLETLHPYSAFDVTMYRLGGATPLASKVVKAEKITVVEKRVFEIANGGDGQ